VLSWWVFGIFVVSLITIFSTIFTSNSGVLLSTGGVVFASYLLGVIPKINKFLPTFLTDGNSLIYGVLGASKYVIALIITIVLTLICFISSVIIFNKKQL
jgi:ABC-2 type transport system permease protein